MSYTSHPLEHSSICRSRHVNTTIHIDRFFFNTFRWQYDDVRGKLAINRLENVLETVDIP